MRPRLVALTFWMLAMDTLGAGGNYVAFTNHLLKPQPIKNLVCETIHVQAREIGSNGLNWPTHLMGFFSRPGQPARTLSLKTL